MGLVFAAQTTINSLSTINPLVTITITSIGYGKKLPNLAKTYPNLAKYNDQYDNSTIKLANL